MTSDEELSAAAGREEEDSPWRDEGEEEDAEGVAQEARKAVASNNEQVIFFMSKLYRESLQNATEQSKEALLSKERTEICKWFYRKTSAKPLLLLKKAVWGAFS